MRTYYFVELNGFKHQYDYLEDAELFYEQQRDNPENEVKLFEIRKIDISY